jgi:hypothetical protein
MLDELDERTAGITRVNEGHQTMESGPRLAIDQLDPFVTQSAQLGANIGDTKSDVVETLPTPFQEPCDGPTAIRGLDQLELRVADGEEGHLDALIGHVAPSAHLEAE